jgi:DNA gyrase inhibitor GyrI
VGFRRFLPFLAAFVLPLLVVYAWWGGFNKVEIIEGQVRGPYHYAYVEHQGDYSKLPDQQAKVEKYLLAAKIKPGSAITVLYSNPDVVNVNERRARVGYLVPASAKVYDPIKLGDIPARSVLLARVQAAVLLAPSRVYQRMDRYLQQQGRGIRMPTVEIYEPSGSPMRMGVLTVEMPE